MNRPFPKCYRLIITHRVKLTPKVRPSVPDRPEVPTHATRGIICLGRPPHFGVVGRIPTASYEFPNHACSPSQPLLEGISTQTAAAMCRAVRSRASAKTRTAVRVILLLLLLEVSPFVGARQRDMNNFPPVTMKLQ